MKNVCSVWWLRWCQGMLLGTLSAEKAYFFLRNDAAVVGTVCGLHSWNACHIVSCCCCQLLLCASRCSSTSGGQVGRGTWGSAMSPRHSSHIAGPKVREHRRDSPALEKENTGGSLSVWINACSIKMWQFISAVTSQKTWFITTNCSFLLPNDSQLYSPPAPGWQTIRDNSSLPPAEQKCLDV